jgi:hypothetical protein
MAAQALLFRIMFDEDHRGLRTVARITAMKNCAAWSRGYQRRSGSHLCEEYEFT